MLNYPAWPWDKIWVSDLGSLMELGHFDCEYETNLNMLCLGLPTYWILHHNLYSFIIDFCYMETNMIVSLNGFFYSI